MWTTYDVILIGNYAIYVSLKQWNQRREEELLFRTLYFTKCLTQSLHNINS